MIINQQSGGSDPNGTYNNKAVAVFVGPDIDLYGFTGDSISGGGIYILQGPDRGEWISFVDMGVGPGLDASIAMKFGSIKYSGNIDNLGIDAFYGWREETNVGAGFELDVTFGFSKSERYRGGYLYSESLSVGYGISLVPGTANRGRTMTWNDFLKLFE